MSNKTFRSRLIPAIIAVATLASVPVPAAAATTARAGAHAVRAQRSGAVTSPSLPKAEPGPRMI